MCSFFLNIYIYIVVYFSFVSHGPGSFHIEFRAQLDPQASPCQRGIGGTIWGGLLGGKNQEGDVT